MICKKKISNHFNIYEENSYPEIHITLNKIKKDVDIKQVSSVIEKITDELEPVEITIKNFDCYLKSENNFLVLQLEKTKSLYAMGKRLHQKLSKKGFSTIQDFKKWEFHITIISNYFAQNPLSETNFEQLCLLFSGLNFPKSALASEIELWRFTLDPHKKCLRSFSLAD